MAEAKATIREYFGLQRPGFMLDPKSDYECYAGRSDEKNLLVERIEAASDKESAPKLVLWGVYGGGKTHTQFYAGKRILKDYNADSVYVVCPDLPKNGTFLDLYKEILMTIGSDRVKTLLQQYLLKVREAKFREFFANEAMSNVSMKLVLSTTGGEDYTKAWRWLTGEQVSAGEAISLGATAALTAREAARLLIKLGEIYDAVEKRKLAILIDELEKLNTVTDPHGLDTFNTAFREMAEGLQRHLGFICACFASDYEGIVKALSDEAVSSRIGDGNYIPISQLRDEQLKPFIKDLLSYVVDQKAKEKKIKELKEKRLSISEDYFPFSEEAINQIITYIAEDVRRKTPRVISDMMNDAATEAKRLGKAVIDEQSVLDAIRKREIAPRPSAAARPRRRRGA